MHGGVLWLGTFFPISLPASASAMYTARLLDEEFDQQKFEQCFCGQHLQSLGI